MKSLRNFPVISEKQWKQKIQFELEGLDYNNTLLSKNCGINIKPFYTNTDCQIEIKSILRHDNLESVTDIITQFAKNGVWKKSENEDFKILKQKLHDESAIHINTSLYANLGANIIQQLAYSLAIADEYTNYHTKFNFTFNIGSNYFLEISKICAFNNLWELFVKHNSLKNAVASSKIIPTQRNKTNKTIDEVIYATEYLCIHSSKNAVDGTFYINSTTKQIIEESFNLYLLIKNSGGFIKQLRLGNIQRKIKNSASKDKFKPNIVKNSRKTVIQTIPKVKFKDNHISISHPLENDMSINKIDISGHASGFPPYLRGISTTMYTRKTWKNIEVSSYSSRFIIINGSNSLTDILKKGINHIKSEYKKNNSIDNIVKNVIFNIKMGDNHFKNIAKIRALRVLWSNIIQEYNPTSKDSLAMYIHSDILGETLNEKTNKSLSAILGGIQSIDTEPIINDFLINETNITKVIDPWGGSYLIEELTNNFITDTWKEICNII